MSLREKINVTYKLRIGVNGKRMVKNSAFSMFGSILGQFIALISSLIIGRLLGASGLGSYTFAMTFSGIVFLFLNLGLGGIFQRNISQDRASAEKNYANAITLRLCFSMPASLVIGTVCVVIIRRQEDMGMLLLACVYTGLTGIFSLVSEGITAIEKFQVTFAFDMLQKILCLIATFVTLYFTKSMLVLLLLHDVIFVILILVELFYVNKMLCRVRLEFDVEFCKALLKESFPTIFGSAAEYLSLKSDSLVLTLMLGEAATGLYSVSSNIYIAASFVPLAIAKAATPIFNRMIAQNQEVHSFVKRTIQMMTFSSIVLIVGIFLVGRWGIVLLWGNDFEGATAPLWILSLSLLFMPVNRFLEYMLIGMRQQMLVAKCNIIGAVFNIVTNVLLVPILGLYAVALTTVVTEFLVMGMQGLFFLKKHVKRVMV